MFKQALLASASFFALSVASAQEDEKEPNTTTKSAPTIKQISENEYQIGKITLDKSKRELRFGAGVNMIEGLIEYFLVTTKSDKVHETLFLTDISPLNLNIAMKLLGIKESKELFEIIDEKTWQPTGKFPQVSPEIRAASLVDITITWSEDDKNISLPIHELIHHIDWPEEADTPSPGQEIQTTELSLSLMEEGPWLSTGSYLHEGLFKAEVDGMIFAIYSAEQAIVNFPGKDRHLGDVWIPNKKTVPALGTAVQIIIKPHSTAKK